MQISFWKITLGVSLSKASNDTGLCIGIEFYKSPYWEVELALQALFPWQLAFRVAQRLT